MKFNSLILRVVFVFLISITAIYCFNIYSGSITLNEYAYNELFINYETGFIRRGLLGQIFLLLNDWISIKPKLFFTTLFFLLYLLQIILFYKVFEKIFKLNSILILFLFSPVFILFTIYDPNIFFIKDIFIKISILIHAYIFIKCHIQQNLNKYLKLLKYLVMPILIIFTLIHEYQIFFVSVHILISVGFIKEKKSILKILKIYIPLLILFILLIFFIGDESQYFEMNKMLQKYNVELHPQLKGGLYTAIGGFYKWHFHYFTYSEFIELFICLILGIFIFYLFFEKLIQEKILLYNSNLQKNNLVYFLPCLLIFILAHIDHGRNISLIGTNLVAYYATLNLNKKKFNDFYLSFNNAIIYRSFLILFLFFYIFMWQLDQYAGYSMRGENNTIFQSTLFSEIIKFVNYSYYFIDLNVISLPDLNL